MYCVRAFEEKDKDNYIQLKCKISIDSSMLLYDKSETDLLRGLLTAHYPSQISDPNKSFGVFIDDLPVGFLDLTSTKSNRRSHVFYIVMGVITEHLRQGNGSLLLDHAYHFAQSLGKTRLELSVLETNQAAINLYQKNGFVTEGLKRGSIQAEGMPVNEIIMARYLS